MTFMWAGWSFGLIHSILCLILTVTTVYATFLGLLVIPAIQNQAVYLNKVSLTWFKDINVPEQWGFLRNQVTPFNLHTLDGETLRAWHVLPLELYRQNEEQLVFESPGLVSDITTRLGFKLLRDDPSSLLVLYLHGAAGTLGSGWRPPSYRAISAGASNRIHIVAIDYRGFGSSSGTPSEEGLLTDALALVHWAIEEAGIPSSRVVLFSQSLGTAVAISLAQHLAAKPEPVLFSGVILVAPFVDVKTLTATYRLGGVVPLLSPIARVFPQLLAFLNTLIISKWPTKDKVADFVRQCENMSGDGSKYHINIIHAKDDYDIPWTHSEQLFWHAVNASTSMGISYEELEKQKEDSRTALGAGGWSVTHHTPQGLIREDILEHGLHDRIMSYPIVSLAILRAFERNNKL